MQENYEENCGMTYFLLFIDIAFLAWVFHQELKQALDRGKEYLNAWNLVDMGAVFFSFIVTVCILFRAENISFNTLRIVACLASFCLWVKMYDWVRIFEATTSYI